MNGLANFFQIPFHFEAGAFQGLLAKVDGVRQKFATLLDAFGVGAFFQLQAFVFKEVTDVPKQLIFVDLIHKFSNGDPAELWTLDPAGRGAGADK